VTAHDDEVLGFMFLMVIAATRPPPNCLPMPLTGVQKPRPTRPVFDDHSLVKPWVEETLRYDTSSQILARAVADDIEMYDKTIPAGDVMLLLPGSANRDDRVFDAPTTIASAARSARSWSVLAVAHTSAWVRTWPDGGPGGSDRILQAN